jgi:hypothetical protein
MSNMLFLLLSNTLFLFQCVIHPVRRRTPNIAQRPQRPIVSVGLDSYRYMCTSRSIRVGCRDHNARDNEGMGERAVRGTAPILFEIEEMKLKVEAEARMDKVVVAEAVCATGASVAVRRFRPVRDFLNCSSVRLRRDNVSRQRQSPRSGRGDDCARSHQVQPRLTHRRGSDVARWHHPRRAVAAQTVATNLPGLCLAEWHSLRWKSTI